MTSVVQDDGIGIHRVADDFDWTCESDLRRNRISAVCNMDRRGTCTGGCNRRTDCGERRGRCAGVGIVAAICWHGDVEVGGLRERRGREGGERGEDARSAKNSNKKARRGRTYLGMVH